MRSAIGDKLRTVLLAVAACTIGVCHAADVKAPNVIFDTDMWGDIDDMLALAMLHALHDRGEINLLAVTSSTEEPWCASYIELINTFYGHPEIPVGMVRNGVTAEATMRKINPDFSPTAPRALNYTQAIAERRNSDGSPVYPQRLGGRSEVPDALALLRKTLAAQPDNGVVLIQVGFSTNLAHLLKSSADANSPLDGITLVKKKVRLLSVMAGNFGETQFDGKKSPKGTPEFNLILDVPSAQEVFSKWPTPVVASGFEIGLAILYPGTSVDHDYSYVANHPIADTYRYFCKENKLPKCPHEHATFDLTSVLYAARPDRNYFSLSQPGKITVLADGGSRFEESEGGSHRYLILSKEQKARTLEAMVMLASQPPVQSSIP